MAARGLDCTDELRLVGATVEGNIILRSWLPVERHEPDNLYVKEGEFFDKLQNQSALPTRIGCISALNLTAKFIRLTGVAVSGDIDLQGSQLTGFEMGVWRTLETQKRPGEAEQENEAEKATMHLDRVLIRYRRDSLGVRPIPAYVQGQLKLVDSHIMGPLQIVGATVQQGVSASNVKVEGECRLATWDDSHGNIRTAFRTRLGKFESEDRALSLDFRNSTFGSNVILDGIITESGIDLFSAQIRGSLTADPGLKTSTTKGRVYCPAVIGQGRDNFGRKFSLRFTSATVNGNLVMRSCFCESAVVLENSTINGELDLGPFRFQNQLLGQTMIGVGAWSMEGERLVFEKASGQSAHGEVRLRTYTNSGPRFESNTINRFDKKLIYTAGSNGPSLDHESRWVSIFAEGLTVNGNAGFTGILCLGAFKASRARFNGNFSITSISGSSTNARGVPAIIYGGAAKCGRPYSLQLANAYVGGSVDLSGGIFTAGLYLNRMQIDGNLVCRTLYRINPAVIAWSLDDKQRRSAFRAFGLRVGGMAEFEGVELHGGFHLENAVIGQSLTLSDLIVSEESRARLSKDYNITCSFSHGRRSDQSEYLVVLSGASLKSNLRISNCDGKDLYLHDTKVEGVARIEECLFDAIHDEQSRCETLEARVSIDKKRTDWPKRKSILHIAFVTFLRSLPIIAVAFLPLLAVVGSLGWPLLVTGPTLLLVGVGLLLVSYFGFFAAMQLSVMNDHSATERRIPVHMKFERLKPLPPSSAIDNEARKVSYKAVGFGAITLFLYLGVAILVPSWSPSGIIGLVSLVVATVLLFRSVIHSQRSYFKDKGPNLKNSNPAVNNLPNSSDDYNLAQFLRTNVFPIEFYRNLLRTLQARGDEKNFRVVTILESPNLASDRGQRKDSVFVSWFLHFTMGDGLRLAPLLCGLFLLLVLATSLFARPESVVRKDYHKSIQELSAYHQLALLNLAGEKSNLMTKKDIFLIRKSVDRLLASNAVSSRPAGPSELEAPAGLSPEGKLVWERLSLSESAAKTWLHDYLTPDDEAVRDHKLVERDGLLNVDWRQRNAVGMTLRYFVPFAEFASGSEWEASPAAIEAPPIVQHCPMYRWMILDSPGVADQRKVRAFTYQDLATVLTVTGWLFIPLLIGGLTGRLRSKSAKLESE